jgi:hypothetical protein
MLIDCAGTGHDGEIQAGSELPYIDTGLTIIDDNTRLEWSKQDYNVGGGCDSYPGNLSINCFFNWDEAFEFVATLNANAYAGHTDWRLPNVKELFSLLRFDGIPMISDAFDNECTVGCTVETCSCLAGEYYSSTTYQLEPYDPFITSPSHANEAYIVNLINSNVTTSVKTENRQARAVRGGL